MKELKKYYRQVGSWLPCSGRMKRDIMDRIRTSVSTWLEEHPNADMPALIAHFGTPQQIAATYVDEMGTQELLRDLRIRRKIVRIVTAGVATFLAIWIGVITILTIGAFDSKGSIVADDN